MIWSQVPRLSLFKLEKKNREIETPIGQ